MEPDIKQVISTFVKLPADQVNENTRIDRKAVGSSIHLHRMYANLLKLGIVVENYKDISTLGELMARTGLNKNDPTLKRIDNTTASSKENIYTDFETINPDIGIDIERSSEFPSSGDYRKEAFYLQNFAPSEISYAILQPNPPLTFTGLFAAKEALVKARADLHNLPFNEIEIKHDSNGKPGFTGMSISISHIDDLAVAVAVSGMTNTTPEIPHIPEFSNAPGRQSNILAWVAILFSLLALVMTIL